jgi:peptide/nickel transport system permease protein
MALYILRRLLNGLLVIAGVILIIFFLFAVLPADPARMMLGQQADSASVALINKDLGRDLPIQKQFLLYVNDLSPISIHTKKTDSPFFLDNLKYPSALKIVDTDSRTVVVKPPYLRRSYQSKKNVSGIIMEKLPDTAALAFAAIIFAALFGIPLGAFAALKKNTTLDKFILAISLSGVSIPSFFASIIFAWIFGFVLSPITGLNMTGGLYEIDAFEGIYIEWKNLILPAIVLGLRPMAIIVQLMRSSMLDVLSQDYIRTARAKGLSARVILFRHALKNSLNPVITSISGWLGSLLAGAVFIEYIFGWNGIGKLTVTALENYDLPVVTGIVLFISIVFIILNIFADILNGIIDPRIRVH